MKKLHGKALDDELTKRRQAKEIRLSNRLTFRDAAHAKGISPSEYLSWENGYDICPHDEWKDEVAGVPLPKLILRVCKKCGKTDETSMEKVNINNADRTFRAYNETLRRVKEDKK